MRPAWVGRDAPEDVQYERGAGAMMASDGMAFNKVVKTGMRCSGFPALPVVWEMKICNLTERKGG